MKPEAVLRKAIRKLKKHGVAVSAFIDENGAYCAAGAIYSAAGASDKALREASILEAGKGGTGSTKPFIFTTDDESADSVLPVLKALEKVIRRAEFGGRYDAYRGIYTSTGIAMFGDDYPELVIRAMQQALLEA